MNLPPIKDENKEALREAAYLGAWIAGIWIAGLVAILVYLNGTS